MNAGTISNVAHIVSTGSYVLELPSQSGTIHLDTTLLNTGATGDGYYMMIYNPSTRLKMYRPATVFFPTGRMYTTAYRYPTIITGITGANLNVTLLRTYYHLVTPGSLGNSTGAFGTSYPTTFDVNSNYFDMPTGGVLRYTGEETNLVASIDAQLSIAINSNTTIVHYSFIAKTTAGVTTIVPGSDSINYTSDSGAFITNNMAAITTLTPGDRFSLVYLQNSSASAIQIPRITMVITCFPN
jgi:hypothetical protein